LETLVNIYLIITRLASVLAAMVTMLNPQGGATPNECEYVGRLT